MERQKPSRWRAGRRDGTGATEDASWVPDAGSAEPMDLRTKLIFAFVAISLASMFTLGAFGYFASARPTGPIRNVSLRL